MHENLKSWVGSVCSMGMQHTWLHKFPLPMQACIMDPQHCTIDCHNTMMIQYERNDIPKQDILYNYYSANLSQFPCQSRYQYQSLLSHRVSNHHSLHL